MNTTIKNLMNQGFDLKQIKDALEDGAFLAAEGITQEEAEEAHAEVKKMIGNRITGKNIDVILKNYEFVTHAQRMEMRTMLEKTSPEAWAEYEALITERGNQMFADLKK